MTWFNDPRLVSSGLLLVVAVAVAGLYAGCASSSAVQKAPLSPESQQALRQSLVGTWRHTETVKNGNREPMKSAKITWTFNKDGSGTFHQVVPSANSDVKRPFEWRLEGRNIILENAKTGKTTTYRADTWGQLQMKWFNYQMSNHYIVQRVE